VRIAAHIFSPVLQGAPISQFQMITGLRARGFSIEGLTSEDGPLLQWYRDSGIPITHVPAGEDAVAFAAKWIEEIKPDVVYANTLATHWFVRAAVEKGWTTAWNIRESADVGDFFPDDMDARLNATRLLGRVSRVIFVSEATATLYRENVPMLATHQVIHNGISFVGFDPPDRRVARRRPDNQPSFGELIIGNVGTLCPRKAQHLLVRSFAILRQERPHIPVRLLLVGSSGDPEYSRWLEDFIDLLGLSDCVELLPETSAITEWYRVFDVFAMPSLEESLPRVVMEAMAIGLPVVAADVFGVAEQIQHGIDGLLASPGDVRSMANWLIHLIDDEGFRLNMGVAAARSMRDRFGIDRMLDAYEREFRILREDARIS
jgi:glycosyltransferase involved in cell wall biosynthesis